MSDVRGARGVANRHCFAAIVAAAAADRDPIDCRIRDLRVRRFFGTRFDTRSERLLAALSLSVHLVSC